MIGYRSSAILMQFSMMLTIVALCSCNRYAGLDLDEHRDPLVGDPSKLASSTVTIEGAKFTAFAEREWRVLAANSGPVPVLVRFQITNETDHELAFPTFDAFTFFMSSHDGTNIADGGGRDWTEFTEPMLIGPGRSRTLRFETKLERAKRPFGLIYLDYTGWRSSFRPLNPGRYDLHFHYTTAWRFVLEQKTSREMRPPFLEAILPPVTIDVIEP
jgi:hypothetical protein